MATRNKGTVTIYSNAPFDKTYKHVVDWDNHQQLDDFLDSALGYAGERVPKH